MIDSNFYETFNLVLKNCAQLSSTWLNLKSIDSLDSPDSLASLRLATLTLPIQSVSQSVLILN